MQQSPESGLPSTLGLWRVSFSAGNAPMHIVGYQYLNLYLLYAWPLDIVQGTEKNGLAFYP